MKNTLEEFSLWLEELSQDIQLTKNHENIIQLCEKYAWLPRTIVPISYDVFAQNETGYNVLHLLVLFCKDDATLVALLRDYPHEMQYSKTSFGNTPLHFAIQNGQDHFHEYVFEFFSMETTMLNLPSDNICNENNESITHFLAQYSNESIQYALLKHPRLESLICGSAWDGYQSLLDILQAHGTDKIRESSLQVKSSSLESTSEISSEITIEQKHLLYRGHIQVTITKEDNLLIVKYIDNEYEGESIFNISAKTWIGATYGKELDHLVQLYLLYDEKTDKGKYV